MYRRNPLRAAASAGVVCAHLVGILWGSTLWAQVASTQATTGMSSDWPSYGNGIDSHKYAPLAQINQHNAAELEVVWRWTSPDNAIVKKNRTLTPWAFKSTPIKVGDTLYVPTSLGIVAAIDAVTGVTRWQFDTQSYARGRPTNLGFNHRGVAYWPGSARDGAPTEQAAAPRILMPTNDAYLWALDADTGQPVQGFGNAGRIDLTLGLGRAVDRKFYSVISAPLVVGDVVIVGASIMDAPPNKEMPPGHVRGFDIHTGEQIWTFNTIPQKGQFGTETWQDDAWRYSGNTNVWTGMSADPELGYVYLPTGTPTNDWYGGHRLGDNLFAESLVCVEAKTGKRVWHFQMVHHGLWDYDLPAAPTLLDLMIDGEEIPAVAQISKQAFVYTFDRRDGTPIWPIVEQPVPTSSVPGEKSSPTQPIPTKPAPFDQQGLTDANLLNLSPALHAQAKEIADRFDRGPLFTPPSLRGTINIPGWGGGGNWSGAAFDPRTGMYYIPSVTSATVVQLKPGNPDKTNFRYLRSGANTSVKGPQGLPITKPPYARITAIDMHTGEHQWMVPHGDGPRQKVIELGLPDPGPLGSVGISGPVLTETLLFVAQVDGQRNVLRAFDKASGGIVAEIDLPVAPTGTPMTYMHAGRQYISIAGGMGDTAEIMTLGLVDRELSAKR